MPWYPEVQTGLAFGRVRMQGVLTMITIQQLTGVQAQASMTDLIAILQDAVHSGASVGFLPPLLPEEARAYWQKVCDDVGQGSRVLIVAAHDAEMLGTVQLALATQANAQHRAEVQKLMVHTRWRRQGVGQRLMAAIEDAARSCGRTLLVLDTRQGDISEPLYQKMGYERAGSIPQYARSATGDLDATVMYYRLL